MDKKIIRAGSISAVSLLIIGLFIGTYGGWQPLLTMTNNILGALVVAIALSIFLSFIYATWFANFLPGSAFARGILFGALVWALFLILGGLFSFFKESVYTTFNPANNLFLSLILFSSWGAISSLSLESKT